MDKNEKGAIPMVNELNDKNNSVWGRRDKKLPVKVIVIGQDTFKDSGTSPPKDPLMTLAQVAGYLGISLDYARHVWPQWLDQKVNPIRLNRKPKGPLRFKQSEILALVDSWRVVTKW